MRVLIIKTSSMAGVIDTLPALTDAKSIQPDLVFDWVVEEKFAEIPGWHPAVANVIPVAFRRWRKHPLATLGSTEWRQFKTQLQRNHYDLIIDAQGIFKSAWVARMVNAPAAGFDKDSARESVAAWFYRHRYNVDKNQHPVERMRELFAKALAYQKPNIECRYGFDIQSFLGSSKEVPYIVLLHSSKLYSSNLHITKLHNSNQQQDLYVEAYWRELTQLLVKQGYRVRIPWSNEQEHQRSLRMAHNVVGAEVLPRLNLHGMACVIAQASAAIAANSGFSHLSAALEVPTLSLCEPIETTQGCAYGKQQICLCGKPIEKNTAPESATLIAAIEPAAVVQELQNLILDKPDDIGASIPLRKSS